MCQVWNPCVHVKRFDGNLVIAFVCWPTLKVELGARYKPTHHKVVVGAGLEKENCTPPPSPKSVHSQNSKLGY